MNLHSSGSGEVDEVACTEGGKEKFNTVHFVWNYITSGYGTRIVRLGLSTFSRVFCEDGKPPDTFCHCVDG